MPRTKTLAKTISVNAIENGKGRLLQMSLGIILKNSLILAHSV